MMGALLSGFYSVGGRQAIMRDSNLMFWHIAEFEDKEYTLATICDGMTYKNYLFTIPGIKKDIFPDLVQKDWYAIVFEGSKESILDDNEPLSPLGREIIEAVDSQTDDNPVLLYFKIPL